MIKLHLFDCTREEVKVRSAKMGVPLEDCRVVKPEVVPGDDVRRGLYGRSYTEEELTEFVHCKLTPRERRYLLRSSTSTG